MSKSNSRSALVTGASYGLGRAISIGLAQRGLNVIATARTEEGLKETANQVRDAGGQCTVIPADLASDEGRALLLQKLEAEAGALTVFVHCASITPDPDAGLLDTDDEAIEALVRTNIKASIFLIRDVARLLVKPNRHTNIILISSDWALRGTHGPPAFSAAKATITHLAHAVRREFAAQKVLISTIIPGDIATFDADWSEPKWSLNDSVDDVRRELGDTRITLQDMVDTINYVLDRKLARVEEILLAPLDPEYDY